MIHSHTALQQNDDVKRKEEGNRFFKTSLHDLGFCGKNKIATMTKIN